MDNKSNDKKYDAVVKGKTEVSKNLDPGNLLSKFVFDGVKTAGKSMIADVFLPKCKQAVFDTLINGLNILFWGPGGKRPSSGVGVGTRIQYASAADGAKPIAASQKVTPTIKKTVDPEDITFESRMDAQSVYDTMIDIIEQYDKVSLADFMELSNVSNDDFTYRKYGWTVLPTPADIRRLGNGSYYIRFPKMQII